MSGAAPTARASGEGSSLSAVFATWWPLAASWLLMGLELPTVSAVMARLPHPTVSLAAYGGVIFPLALLIEAPIIMLLAASTALCRDGHSYRLVRRFMLVGGCAFTGVHVLVAFTPLYTVVASGILGVPDEILEPGRIGMQIMSPWTISIAYRRFQQGVLIRFGRSWAVGTGTVVRLSANALVLFAGYALGSAPGIVVGTSALIVGVMSEAVFAGIAVRPVLANELRRAEPRGEPLTPRGFLRFYVPLAVTPAIMLLGMPLMSGAMSRLPRPIDSLAVWPVLNGLVFTLRSTGFALNEVVVSLIERPGAVWALRRFTGLLAAATSLFLLIVAASPLGVLWFGRVSALPPPLVDLASTGLWIAFLMPALTVYQNWYQGVVVHSRHTRGVTESVAIQLVATGLVLLGGIALGQTAGIHVALAALVAGNAAQTLWLWVRARGSIRELEARQTPGSRSIAPESAVAPVVAAALRDPGPSP